MLLFYLSLINDEQSRVRFSEIYQDYLDWMLRIAYHHVKNEPDAQDIVHDVFMEIIKNDASVPTGSVEETKAYLFVCIRNRASSLIRAKSKQKTVDMDVLIKFPSGDDVESIVSNVITCDQLQEFVDCMSYTYKDVMSLYFVHDMTVNEISKILHIPRATASIRLKRGKTILKERFKDLDI